MKRNVSEGEVIDLLKKRIDSLRSELNRAESALSAIVDDETKLNQGVKREPTGLNPALSSKQLKQSYDGSLTWEKKILILLNQGEGFKDDIVNSIVKLEPSLPHAKVASAVGVKLSILLSKGMISAERIGRKYKYRLSY